MLFNFSLNKLFRFNIGLVLAGGGAKGAYQIGVFKAMKELKLDKVINVISGTSIGALNGALFLMNDFKIFEQAWEKATYDNLLYLQSHSNYVSFRKIIPELFNRKIDKPEFRDILLTQNLSLFSQKGLGSIIDSFIDFKKLQNRDKPLYACAYNAIDKKPEYFRLNEYDKDTGKKILLASSAIPFLYEGVTINDKKYYDGGIYTKLYGPRNIDNVPVKPVFDHGCEIIIIVYLDYKDRLNDSFRKEGVTYIEIYPSEPLTNMFNAGHIEYTKKAIEEKMTLGYRDAMVIIAPLMLKILLGSKFRDLVAEHDAYNKKLLEKYHKEKKQ